jgi:hypothetical protein
MLAAAVHPARAQTIHLDDILEIKGYPPPPDVHSTSVTRVDPPPMDIKGQALRSFLGAYVPVRNEDVIANAFSSASATAVFRDQERGVTFMYAACPWDTASLGMIAGPPHMLVFVVNHDFVIFQRKDLCRNPPPGFQSTR